MDLDVKHKLNQKPSIELPFMPNLRTVEGMVSERETTTKFNCQLKM